MTIEEYLTNIYYNYRSSRPEVFRKKVFLEISQNSQKNTCAIVEFCKISKNTFYYRTPPEAAFVTNM